MLPPPIFVLMDRIYEEEAADAPKKLSWAVIAETTNDAITTALEGAEYLAQGEDFDQLLSNSAVDAVFVDMPWNEQLDWILKSANAGKHILCHHVVNGYEKVAAACEETKVCLVETYRFRFQTHLDHLHEMIAHGDIDGPVVVRISQSLLENDKRNLWDLAFDGVYLACELFGSNPIHGVATLTDDPAAAGTSAQLNVLLSFPNQCTAILDCNTLLKGRYSYEVIGNQGSIRLRGTEQDGSFGVEWTFEGETIVYELLAENSVKVILDHFDECVKMGSSSKSFNNAKILESLKASVR